MSIWSGLLMFSQLSAIEIYKKYCKLLMSLLTLMLPFWKVFPYTNHLELKQRALSASYRKVSWWPLQNRTIFVVLLSLQSWQLLFISIWSWIFVINIISSGIKVIWRGWVGRRVFSPQALPTPSPSSSAWSGFGTSGQVSEIIFEMNWCAYENDSS